MVQHAGWPAGEMAAGREAAGAAAGAARHDRTTTQSPSSVHELRVACHAFSHLAIHRLPSPKPCSPTMRATLQEQKEGGGGGGRVAGSQGGGGAGGGVQAVQRRSWRLGQLGSRPDELPACACVRARGTPGTPGAAAPQPPKTRDMPEKTGLPRMQEFQQISSPFCVGTNHVDQPLVLLPTDGPALGLHRGEDEQRGRRSEQRARSGAPCGGQGRRKAEAKAA